MNVMISNNLLANDHQVALQRIDLGPDTSTLTMSYSKSTRRLAAITSHLTGTEVMTSPLTTHVLDATRGRPATGLAVELHRQAQDGGWRLVTKGETNSDGRCPNLITRGEFVPSVYKLFFDTDGYFTSQKVDGFYPYVEIVFQIKEPDLHHHVPLLLSPYSYSTYRGS